LAEAERAWRDALAGFSSPTPLVIDRSTREPIDQVRRYEERLLPSTTRALAAAAGSLGLTLNTLMQGAWALLLSRYSGERDVVYGATVAGRPADVPAIESMVGLFINTLPVRAQIDPELPVSAFLTELQRRQAELRRYEHMPLVLIQGLSEVPRGQPLFSSLLVFENYPGQRGDSIHHADSLDRTFEQTNYPLTLLVAPGRELVIGALADDRFEDTAVRRLLGHLRRLLEGIASDPQRPVARLGMIGPAERRWLVRDLNATAVAMPPGRLAHHAFEARAREAGDRIALRCNGDALGYAELDARATALAGELRDLGVGPDVIVAMATERDPAMVVALLAVLKSGAAYLPLDPAYPSQRLDFMVQDAVPHVLITEPHLRERLPALARTVTVTADGRLWAVDGGSEQDTATAEATCPEHLAYVIYTSGSTGQPKGVMIPHGAVVNFLASMAREPGLRADDVLLAVTTLSFDIAVLELLLPMSVGAEVVICPRADAADGAALMSRLAGVRATVMQATPTTWRMLIDAGWQGDAGLTVLCGGEPLAPDLAEALLARAKSVWNLYGPTETTVWSSVERVVTSRAPTLGAPIATTQLHVLDVCGQPAPVGVPGEVCIGGAGLARGYLRRPALQAERFVDNPFGGGRLYRTGDLARRRADGALEFLGRMDHQVKIRGFRVELGEIEAVLRRHDAVQDAVSTVVERPAGPQLVAYVTADEERVRGMRSAEPAPTAAELVERWRDRWDETYRVGRAGSDPRFDLSGWTSSVTGLPMPEAEMAEWVDACVGRVRALRARRLLEIGCGTGLLLQRLAVECDEYWATDVSPSALAGVRDVCEQQGLASVRLLEHAAHELGDLPAGHFDVVVLNSVVQYFPSVEYLVDSLQSAFRLLAPGGAVFVGDVRSLPLLRVLHVSAALERARGNVPVERLRALVDDQVAAEQELVLDPALFLTLGRHLGTGADVAIWPRRGRFHNELTRFRYDVVLRRGDRSAAPDVDRALDWERDALRLETLREPLSRSDSTIVAIRGVPDARLAGPLATMELVDCAAEGQTVDDLRSALRSAAAAGGVDPEDVWALADELPYEFEVRCAVDRPPGTYDVVARRRGAAGGTSTAPPAEAADADLRRHANAPAARPDREWLTRGLRAMAEAQLPDYMVPSAIVVLESLPLTPNGKVDRRRLPNPQVPWADVSRRYVAPRTPTEERVAELFTAVLGIDRTGVHDDLFADLGGHSLLATRLVSRIRSELAVEFPLRALFEHPTVAAVAARIESDRAELPPVTAGYEEGTL